jgi:hypothetical protein
MSRDNSIFVKTLTDMMALDLSISKVLIKIILERLYKTSHHQ